MSAFERAKAHFLDGLAHLQAGRAADAAAAFEASLVLVPGRPSTLINLGAARIALGQSARAIGPLDEALALQPDDIDAWCHRGRACTALGRHAQACAAFARALAIDPGHAAARYPHAVSLHRLGRSDEAAAATERLLHDEPNHAAAWSLAGQIHRDAGRTEPARAAFERAIAEGADAAMHRYFVAGLGDDASLPAITPPAYVQALFDDYSDDFEAHLLHALHYRAHIEVTDAARRHATPPWRSVLDLGCGTGLVGARLRPDARRLIGVDLAAQMVERARARGHYDAVVAADIVAHLNETSDRHDLIVAADVFIYIGDLDAAFGGVRRVLDAGGLFCFSVEAHDGAGFRLLPSLRYAHGEPHLRALAARHRFEVVAITPATLREEQRRGVAGLIVALRAPVS